MPSGHCGLLMPQRMYLVNESTAVLGGVALGSPTRVHEGPTMGGVPLPSRGGLTIGQAMWQIRDPDECATARRLARSSSNSCNVAAARGVEGDQLFGGGVEEVEPLFRCRRDLRRKRA